MEDKELKNLQQQLRETRVLAERNNELVKKIYRSIVWGRIGWIVYWVLIIGVAVGAFYFMEPYFESFSETFETLRSQFNAFPAP